MSVSTWVRAQERCTLKRTSKFKMRRQIKEEDESEARCQKEEGN